MTKKKFSHKVIAVFLTLNFLTTIVPFNLIHASNNGPTAPEAVGFEPVDATDMVNLTNGNLSYVLPLMEVEGFPINMSYHAGISPDMEASWAGLGWYLNPGAINRAVNGSPDDWKRAIGIDFTSYSETNTFYSITASASIAGAASIGIGANWGGGQGLSGSVQAQLLFVNAYADTRGNTGVGLQTPFGSASFSNNSKPNYSAAIPFSVKNDQGTGRGSVGYSDGTVSANYSKGKASLGMSFGGSGNFSIGGTNAKGVGGSFSQSSTSENAGDATIDTKSVGISVTVPIGPLSVSLGFRKQKVKVSILKGYKNYKWGALYASEYSSFTDNEGTGRKPMVERSGNFNTAMDGFTDYMYRGNQLDTYSSRLPQSEEEFIGDYSKKIENLNFTFVSYDGYNVAAQGMMGSLTPRVFQNANIIGKGAVAQNEEGDPIHAYWHHGSSFNNVQRKLAPIGSQKPFEFYFNGQYTSTETNDASIYSGGVNQSSLNMNNLLIEGTHNGSATSLDRAHQANFVEVFTNNEIANNTAVGLITPKDIPDNSRDDESLFDPDGIGAYKITAADGKTYHFSIPVYHYERIQRTQLEEQEYRTNTGWPTYNTAFDCKNVSETRQYTRYATHWLLTAVTGPDYIDINNNAQFDKSDYGYWVELEYGKWSDGFVWRSPYQDFVYDYNTNIEDEIEDDDKGYYRFGRKQIYYLDRINTRHRSALFVKDIRYDGYGKALTFKFLNKNKGGSSNLGNSGKGSNSSSLNYTDPAVNVKEANVNYEREYSLMLNKIILVDSDDTSLINENGNSNLGGSFPNYVANTSDSTPNWSSPYFTSHYGPGYSYAIHQEQNVLDVGDIPSNFIENHAKKVIEFNHSYDLVKNTPSSRIGNNTYGTNTEAGRLTLNSVKFLGKGGTDYMPATSFAYNDSDDFENPNTQPWDNNQDIQEYIEAKRSLMDSWGFMQGTYNDAGEQKSLAQLWSLKQISTPTGATINVEYEEDDYWTEAFSRRYWNKELIFIFSNVSNLSEGQTGNIRVEILKDPERISNEDYSFKDYFDDQEEVFIDAWASNVRNYPGNGYRRSAVDILKQKADIIDVQDDSIILEVTGQLYDCHEGCSSVFNKYITDRYIDNDITGSRNSQYQYRERYSQAWRSESDGNGNAHAIIFNLLANKVPEDQSGGGLRVKEIITNSNSNIYKAVYDYSHPTKVDRYGNSRSSGITSYAPVDGLKFVPYQSEVPAPGVMYEYVTMSETDGNNNFSTKTRYRHHVLKPVVNIFDPEVEIEALESDSEGEDQLFWANVSDDYGGLDGNNPKDVEAKEIEININTALIGQIKSMEILNSYGHIMTKTENEYVNGRDLHDNTSSFFESNKGYTKETFNSLKTIFVTNDNGTTIDNSKTKRLLSISSKTEYNNLLRKTTTTSGGLSSYVEYLDVDPWLGSYRNKKIEYSDGSTSYTKMVPAYSKYPLMGSKVLDPINNKNMLTQEAMSITKVNNQVLRASINTWDDTWTYRDNNGIESTQTDIWRKHKTFVWKDDIHPVTGTYLTTVDENVNSYFNWGTGTPTNDKWKNISEVTRYNHWSAPIEAIDINNNFASSKMADNFSKVVSSGNARYTEMYYSGAEYISSGNTFEGEVNGANFRTNEVAHTGEYSVKNSSANDKVFLVSGQASSNHNDLSKDFRPGKYKVSFWSHNQQGVDSATLKLNENSIPVSETVEAGCWKQFNYYVDLMPNSNFNLFVTNTSGGGFYFDDFRMHPVYSSMSSFVYDLNTDELLYTLDGNNMGSAFRYDDVGRLKASYQEVKNTDVFDGGFKIMAQYNQHYKNTSSSNTTYNEDINNCITQSYDPLKLKGLVKNCTPQYNPYDIQYAMYVYGGSGNYKYEWQYLTDIETGQYSNWYQGTNFEFIPYENKYCDENKFEKIWNVKAKVTDLVTGESVTADNQYSTSGCPGYIINPKLLLGVEASTCHGNCGYSKYKFHLYPLDKSIPLPNNTGYLDNNTENSYSVDLVRGDGLFCPQIKYVESSSCKSGYLEYVSITPTHADATNYTYDFYLNCASGEVSNELVLGSAPDPKYANPGMLVIKQDGKIISVIDTNKK